MDARQERSARRNVNSQLAVISKAYHPWLPLGNIDNILMSYGFEQLEPAIYCGREGRETAKVGPNTWLTLTWYKMEETGRYEVICYVS